LTADGGSWGRRLAAPFWSRRVHHTSGPLPQAHPQGASHAAAIDGDKAKMKKISGNTYEVLD